jgi:hypothetical protein
VRANIPPAADRTADLAGGVTYRHDIDQDRDPPTIRAPDNPFFIADRLAQTAGPVEWHLLRGGPGTAISQEKPIRLVVLASGHIDQVRLRPAQKLQGQAAVGDDGKIRRASGNGNAFGHVFQQGVEQALGRLGGSGAVFCFGVGRSQCLLHLGHLKGPGLGPLAR